MNASAAPKPVAITLGEPSGIGTECAIRAWQELRHDIPLYIIGDERLIKDVPTTRLKSQNDIKAITSEKLAVFHIAAPEPVELGTLNPGNAQTVIDWIAAAVDHVQSGCASAVMTGPIHKANLKDGAGFPFPGHTEYLAHLAQNSKSIMMLACPDLKVVPATIHIPIKDVPQNLKFDDLFELFMTLHDEMQRKFAISKPRLAVAGLNPHAGEDGHIGREEIDIITPAIKKAKKQGLKIHGPLSADTMFHAAARQSYDVAICMYHDQALIPIKTLGIDLGVNITLGLPFIRTSPDHGTALGIAGKGQASAQATIEAIKSAWAMAQRGLHG